MVRLITGLVGFTWLFPLYYLLFGAENVWWILSLTSIGAMIIHLAGLEWVLDKLDIEKDMDKYTIPFFYYIPMDCDCNDHHHGGGED